VKHVGSLITVPIVIIKINVLVGVNIVISSIFNKISKIGLVEIMKLTNLLKKTQLKANRCKKVVEWIEYEKFKNVEYLAKGKGGFGTTYKAIWKEGCIKGLDHENNQWKRYGETKVALKCLHDSKDITAGFLREVSIIILVIKFFL